MMISRVLFGNLKKGHLPPDGDVPVVVKLARVTVKKSGVMHCGHHHDLSFATDGSSTGAGVGISP